MELLTSWSEFSLTTPHKPEAQSLPSLPLFDQIALQMWGGMYVAPQGHLCNWLIRQRRKAFL